MGEKKQMSLFPYRVLHDIWLMCHPRMTLYLMEGQTGKQEGRGRMRELFMCLE